MYECFAIVYAKYYCVVTNYGVYTFNYYLYFHIQTYIVPTEPKFGSFPFAPVLQDRFGGGMRVDLLKASDVPNLFLVLKQRTMLYS